MNLVRSSFFGALCLALWILLTPAQGHACKCMPQTVEQAREQAEAIFEGQVTEIADVPMKGDANMTEKRVSLRLVRVWKQLDSTETVDVTTSSSSASCGFAFEKGQSYLVYAGRGEQGYTVSACSRTRPMGDASEDLAGLGGGVTPVEVKPSDKQAAPPAKAAPKARGCAAAHGGTQAGLWWLAAPFALGFCWRRR
jgi:hypothetical protein